MARSNLSVNNENSIEKNNTHTPSPKGFKIRRVKELMSDSDVAYESDSSILSNKSTSSPRRNRKIWNEAEEACLISGVGKHGEEWDNILNDSEYSFNDRQAKDLRNKYRALIKFENGSSLSKSPLGSLVIFDIRSKNEKVTEVFIGSDWSSSQWVPSESVANFETLLANFEKKIAAKQKMISRISPAKTPSRLISSLALNSGVKRGKNVDESSQEEFDETPLKKVKKEIQSSPLSVRSNKSSKSLKSTKSTGILVHSDLDDDTVVYPDEESEPSSSESKSIINRCIIM